MNSGNMIIFIDGEELETVGAIMVTHLRVDGHLYIEIYGDMEDE